MYLTTVSGDPMAVQVRNELFYTCCICDCGFVFLVFDLLEIMRGPMAETPGSSSSLVDEHHCFMPIFVW